MNPAVQLEGRRPDFPFYRYLTERSGMAIVLFRTPVLPQRAEWRVGRLRELGIA